MAEQPAYQELENRLRKQGVPFRQHQFQEMNMSEKPSCEELERRVRELEQIIASRSLDEDCQKWTEKILQDRESLHRAILQTAMDGFWIADLQGKFLEVNDAYCRMSGYSKSELLAMTISDIENMETHEDTIRHMKKIMAQGEDRFKSRHRHRDGRIIDIEVSAQYMPAEGGRMVAFLRDITEMKTQEEDIRLRSLVLDQIQDMVTITDLDGVISYVNQAVVEKLGRPKEDLLGRSTDIYGEYPQQGATQREIVIKTLKNGSWRGELVNFATDGTEVILDCRTRVVYDTLGAPKALCGVATDITAYKGSEKELRESEERFRLMVKNTSDIIVVVNPDGAQRYVSLAVERISGYRPEEVIGKPIDAVIHPDDMNHVMKVWHEALEHPTVIFKVQYRHIHKTREWVDLEAVGQCFINEPAIKAIVVSVRDITERKQAEAEKILLEARIRQAQKMEAIGSLAGGIAHDLNNILFPISGLSEMLLEDIPEDNHWHENVGQIHKSAKRGSDLVKQILAFARQSNPQKLPIRIQPILKEVVKLARATIPMNIDIESLIDSHCGTVSADPTQFYQIAMNLITNASHALEDTGGTIRVGLKESMPEKNQSHDGLMKSGKYACMTISDTGTGIDQSLLHKIFEPYFTTKSPGKGAGLGLSVVHGIVKEHDGDIQVVSEIGKGTAFQVYLPLMEDGDDKKMSL